MNTGHMKKLNDLANIPIPSGKIQSTSNYGRIPIVENSFSNEPLEPISKYEIEGCCYYARNDGFNMPYNRKLAGTKPDVFLRKTLCLKLRHINRKLQKAGLELFVWDGYRSIKCQIALWNFFSEAIRKRYAIRDQTLLDRRTAVFCSNPFLFARDNPRTWPVHSTGGAVDLTIRTRNTREFLWMGGNFDDPAACSHTHYYEKILGRQKNTNRLPAASMQALQGRRLLYWLMTDAGFANYPAEWWHYDWGTQMWVQNCLGKKPVAAFYGYCKNPSVMKTCKQT
jgi:D-alanyl-D-alanine dipeptidase